MNKVFGMRPQCKWHLWWGDKKLHHEKVTKAEVINQTLQQWEQKITGREKNLITGQINRPGKKDKQVGHNVGRILNWTLKSWYVLTNKENYSSYKPIVLSLSERSEILWAVRDTDFLKVNQIQPAGQ